MRRRARATRLRRRRKASCRKSRIRLLRARGLRSLAEAAAFAEKLAERFHGGCVEFTKRLRTECPEPADRYVETRDTEADQNKNVERLSDERGGGDAVDSVRDASGDADCDERGKPGEIRNDSDTRMAGGAKALLEHLARAPESGGTDQEIGRDASAKESRAEERADGPRSERGGEYRHSDGGDLSEAKMLRENGESVGRFAFARHGRESHVNKRQHGSHLTEGDGLGDGVEPDLFGGHDANQNKKIGA